ncbi:hypothetical protein CIPAW_13G081500 [Carya illinoinensis]|uniref:Uncharacterized protein n=1 Tax=Carya illinoinensis TaxID=32201 RepID=A0A8T1NHG7_CARIL|nr:hypothetical protein CIPAW_13G081500 [Carya illinoinensis]
MPFPLASQRFDRMPRNHVEHGGYGSTCMCKSCTCVDQSMALEVKILIIKLWRCLLTGENPDLMTLS